MAWRAWIECWEELGILRDLRASEADGRIVLDTVALWVSGEVTRSTAYLAN
jgi:hypothetical protein